jgi:hypothetical protein
MKKSEFQAMFNWNGWVDWWIGTSPIIMTDWLVSKLKNAAVSSEDTIKPRGKRITKY